MPYAEVNDIRVFYEEAGEGEPLLLLHGALGAVDPAVSSGWFALLPALATRYRTIALETRGHGRTTNPAGTLAYGQLGEDVAAFIDQMGLGPVHLAGFSDGATIGRNCCAPWSRWGPTTAWTTTCARGWRSSTPRRWSAMPRSSPPSWRAATTPITTLGIGGVW
jgi:hypothetical protein